jgi:hypothetical protein
MMLRTAALPLLVVLMTALNVSAAPAQAPADGPCYQVRPLPALPSGTRVFVQMGLTIHVDRPDSVTPPGDTVKSTAPAPNTGAVMRYTDPKGHTTTVRPAAFICAYPPDTALPSNLNGVTPDLIMP